jgi:hypothetical protein
MRHAPASRCVGVPSLMAGVSCHMSGAACICSFAVLGMTMAVTNRADAQASQEVEVADELRTAFYEHAPRSLEDAMSKAVASRCSADGESVGWLCSGRRLAYFRSVYVNGAKGRHGLVCENNGTAALKYFGMDLVATVLRAGSCVSAEFNGSAFELSGENGSGRDD